MEKDIFIGLLGFPTDLFIKSKHPDNIFCQLCLNTSLTYIRPGEIYILEKLCALSNSYAAYSKYSKSYDNCSVRAPGVYFQSLLDGLSEIMLEYRLKVVECELDYTTNTYPLSYLIHGLEKYIRLFPVLDSLLLELTVSPRSHGCILLDFIGKSLCLADISARSSLLKIFNKLQAVLFRQISIWCIYGILYDFYFEFFIHECKQTNSPEYSDKDRDSFGIHSNIFSDVNNYSNHFEIQKALLPNCINNSLAEKILFVGEAVCHFSSSVNQHSNTLLNIENLSEKSLGLLTEYEPHFNQNLLKILNDTYFWEQSLERELEILKNKVNCGVMSLIYKQGNILSQMKLLKDFFLQGRGEIFLSFVQHIIDKESKELKIPEKEISEIFHHTLIAFQFDLLLQENAIFFFFTAEIPNLPNRKLEDCFKTLRSYYCDVDTFHLFNLSCSIKWPLQVLLNSSVVSQYELIFGFLIKIRRAHVCLLEVWTNYRRSSPFLHSSCNSEYVGNVWEIHSQMRFILDSLQYYVFSDVIQVQYKIFCKKVKDSQSFEQIILIHEEFISVLIDRLFISSLDIFTSILKLLEFVERFHIILKNTSNRIAPFDMNALKPQFNFNCLNFYKKFDEHGNNPNPSLPILLLRMDYNQYYTNILNTHQSQNKV